MALHTLVLTMDLDDPYDHHYHRHDLSRPLIMDHQWNDIENTVVVVVVVVMVIKKDDDVDDADESDVEDP